MASSTIELATVNYSVCVDNVAEVAKTFGEATTSAETLGEFRYQTTFPKDLKLRAFGHGDNFT